MILPQVLTKNTVLEALESVSGKKSDFAVTF